MSNDAKFIPGLFVKEPHERAPDFIRYRLSFKNAEVIAFLQKRVEAGEEYTNADIKESRDGKPYAAMDDWKPDGKGGASKRPQRQADADPTPDNGDDFSDDILW